jgi:peptidoglycan/LPS O-acetylase OafA/YrhL
MLKPRTDHVSFSLSHGSVNGTNRLAPLTGLRGVAACSVLLAHAIDTAFVYEHTVQPFTARIAYFGMSLFFVLSGFVIHYNYSDLFNSEPLKTALSRFYIARFARLYPLYAVGIFCSLPMIPLPYAPWIVISYLTMTQSWINAEMTVFPPDWSISTEWFFYLVFIPLTMILANLRRPMRVFIVFSIVIIVGFSITFALWRDPITAFADKWFWHGNTISAGSWGWVYYFSPYVRIFEFISGMLMAQAYKVRDTEWLPSIVLPICLMWCGIVFISGWLPPWAPLENLVPNFIYAPAIALVMLHVCKRKSWLSDALSSRPMVFLGEISYSIYIWSFFIMTMLSSMFASAHPITIAYFNSGLKVIVICAVTVVMAYGSYALIEAPSRRWIREVLTGKAGKAAMV